MKPTKLIDLDPYLALLHPQDVEVVDGWLSKVLPNPSDGTLQVLDALGTAVHEAFRYARREAAGVQTPAETIRLGERHLPRFRRAVHGCRATAGLCRTFRDRVSATTRHRETIPART